MIDKASEVKQLLISGWELWYIGFADRLPGRWEMRHGNQIKPVSWEAIERARRDLDWFRDNTTEVEEGRNWIYMHKQVSLRLPPPFSPSRAR